MYPFPVFFGLHNGSAAWPYVITWDWDVIAIGDDKNRSMYENVANEGWLPGIAGVEQPGPPSDRYLIIDPVDGLINTTAQHFLLRYSFGITHSCDETTGEVPLDRHLDVSFSQEIFFSLDAKNGNLPDLTAVGPCATPIGSVGILKEVRNFKGACPVLSGPQPTQSCALSLNDTLAEKVTARMIRHAECPDQTWPNVTRLLGRCRPDRSGQSQLWNDATLLSYVAVFASFLVLSLL